MLPTLTALPTDILILVFSTLSATELAAISQTCQMMHALISEFGWTSYAHSHPRPSYSLSSARQQWPSMSRVKYDCLTDRAWAIKEFVARPLSSAWASKEQPVLAISPSRLIVAARATLYSYSFGNILGGAPAISREATIPLNDPRIPGRNITSITFLEDGGLDRTLLVAYQEHLVEHITLIPVVRDGHPTLSIIRTFVPQFPGDYIEGFSTSRGSLLSISSNGTGILQPQSLDDVANIPPSTIELAERSWTCHLSMASSSPFAAFGATGKSPLTIHSIQQDQLSPLPSAILHTEKVKDLASADLPSSAVYGISQAPLSSPWGSSPQVLVSGWFDGRVRIYDLRSSSSAFATSREGVLLRPVMSVDDRWSSEPIYALSCGGGSSSQIAAGTARHSVVSFWDVRAPKKGWSVHAPGNDRSPVFSVILESSRFFGATEYRPFVYDFGPGATIEAYPPMRSGDREGLKRGTSSLTYRVVKYTHAGSGLLDCNWDC